MIGDIYRENDDFIAIAAAETVQLQGISLDALASLQKCEEIEKVKQGQHPSTVNFETVNYQNSGIELFCETSSNKGPRPYIPKSLTAQIIQSIHVLDHKGIENNKARIASQYFWPSLKQDIKTFIQNCHTCKLVKPNKKLASTGTFEVPDKRMSHVMVDICGP